MLEKHWYSNKISVISCMLWPISYIFSKVSNIRRLKQQRNQYKSKIPVIVVGNISVGGTGKTPVVRMLAKHYLQQGIQPIIISRGYGAKAESYPFEVNKSTSASECGDEPAMLYDALEYQVPIIIGPKRIDSIKYIENKYSSSVIIICDDGLQHYNLARDKEIVVVDASRMFGNHLCIPAGPLRECINRLKSVDSIIVIGNCNNEDRQLLEYYNNNIKYKTMVATEFVNLCTNEKVAIENFSIQGIVALAGISNPSKFFSTLESLSIIIKKRKIFKDHHKFIKKDFNKITDKETVVMTYKDAIKCKKFAKDNWWYLDVNLEKSAKLY